ncbi:MAG: LysM peptidoglycan-binding domain-containing protein [Bdellovibrionota bacterium]
MTRKTLATVLLVGTLVWGARSAYAEQEEIPLEETPVSETPVEEAPAETPAAAPAEGAPTGPQLSPEMQEVRRLQGEVPTDDSGANVRARVDMGGKMPLSIIGEGASEAPQVYIVKQGDTLWDISARFLNDPFLWTKVHSENPQIVNPDLIYPGEPITVYPKDFDLSQATVVQLVPPPELERSAAEEEAPTAAEIEVGQEVVPEVEIEQIEEVEPTEQELADRDRYLEELTKRTELEVFDEKATELISKKRAVLARRQRNVIEYPRAQSVGWIEFLETSELNNAGYLLGQEDVMARVRAASGDLIYINRGKINGVAEGDRYTIFRIGEEVVHPETEEYIGHKIIVVGHLQVQKVYERTSSAIITEAYEDISMGDERLYGLDTYDRIIPEAEVDKNIQIKANSQEINGLIIAAREKKLSISTEDIVYIDRGTKDGVEVGNVFSIYRPNRDVADPEVGDRVELPRFYVGELTVIRTSATTATCLITRERREVIVGDQVSITPITLETEEVPAAGAVTQ